MVDAREDTGTVIHLGVSVGLVYGKLYVIQMQRNRSYDYMIDTLCY